MLNPTTLRALPPLVLLGLSLAGCNLLAPGGRPPPAAGVGGTPMGPTALPPALGLTETAPPPDTALPPTAPVTPTVAVTATLSVTVTPTATVSVALPLPGRPLPASAWRTLIKAPGLPDMSVAPALGPNSHFAVVTGNGGLNTLRSELQQPANAWVTGVTSDTLLIGVFLGRRRGEGHDLEVLDVAVDVGVVNLAVRLSAPGAWQGGDEVFPVHLVALDRSALPTGLISFHFLDAAALGPGGDAPAFDALLPDVDLSTDTLARTETLIIQTANEPPAATPTP